MLPYPLFTIKISENIEFSVYMYGLMIAVGILAAFAVIYGYGKKLAIDMKFLDFVFYDGIASIMLGFGSAAVFQGFYNYLENPEAGFRLDGGITFIGGLIGGAASFIIIYFICRKKLPVKLYSELTLLPCAILAAHGFGRVGCFFAGCCYGRVTDSFLGVKFPDLPNPVHPTQLYEAAFLFLMFGVCSYLLLKKGFRHNMSIYLMAYGVFRFLIEFVRDDDRGSFVGGISPSQFWSLLMIVAGVGVYYLIEYFYRKEIVSVASETEDYTEEAVKKEDEEDEEN